MKDCCFTYQISKFDSLDQFKSIVHQVDSNHNIEYIGQNDAETGNPSVKIFGIGLGGTNFWGESIYRCRSCGKTWYLSDPNFPWKGYLALTSQKK